MKKHNIIAVVSFLSCIFNAYGVDKYVTDDVDVYLRRGPGAQYAYSNSAKAGEKVIELEKNSDGKYTKIQVSNGSVAWIETSKLNDQPSCKERLPSLESELAQYKSKADNADQSQQDVANQYVQKLQDANTLIESLQIKNTELENKLKQQNSQLESMLNQVDDKRRDLIITWFTYGGLVAGGGLILGLILPLIMPRRRKDRWMR